MGLQFEAMKKTAVIIPNYNGEAYLPDCLDALREQSVQDFDVIVVDNGSTDGSLSYLRSKKGITLLEMGTNTGFTGAVNAGIKAAERADYVILLNNDTRAGRHFVEHMIEAIAKEDDVFSVQGMLRKMDDPGILDDGGDYYTVFGWAYAKGKDRPIRASRRGGEIFFACGGAAIYRRDLLMELGLFDDAFFAYLEDADIGWRARRQGYRNLYTPRAQVLHAGSASSGSRYNAFKITHSAKNNVLLLRKNMPLVYRLMLLPFLCAGFLAKTIFFALRGYGGLYVKSLLAGMSMPIREEAGKCRDEDRAVLQMLTCHTVLLVLCLLGTGGASVRGERI